MAHVMYEDQIRKTRSLRGFFFQYLSLSLLLKWEKLVSNNGLGARNCLFGNTLNSAKKMGLWQLEYGFQSTTTKYYVVVPLINNA